MDTIDKAGEEETQIRDGLNHMILESEKVQGPLAQRLVTLEDLYQLLAELEQKLKDIRSKGNLVTHERRVKVADTETISRDRIESLINELENHRDHLSTKYKTTCPMQRGIDYLDYTTETTKKFIEAVNDKYAPYLKEKFIGKVLQRLQYTIKFAELKVKEL